MVTAPLGKMLPTVAAPHPKFGMYIWIAPHLELDWRPGLRKLAVAQHPDHPRRELCLVGVAICVN